MEMRRMTTTVQKVAMALGIVFLLVAIMGFIAPGGMVMAPEAGSGVLLGMFQINLLHNIVHLLFGIWGLAASRSFSGAKSYAQIGGVIYIVLAVCGWLKPDGFGLVPLGGNDVWLHAVLGIVLAGVGFTAKAETVMTTGA
jgi:hypothetical protein